MAQVTMNRDAGIAFERAVVDALAHVGARKNTAPMTVTLPNGQRVTTIPDLWGREVGGIIEAKDVRVLNRSPQLEAQVAEAAKSGVPFNLVVSHKTRAISGPLVRLIEENGGKVYHYDPRKDTLSEFK